MRILTKTETTRRIRTFAIAAAAIACAVRPALAQDRPVNNAAIGEKYHVEASFALWNPSVFGVISSDQFGIVGSDIDFATDLKYEQTKFRDLRFVVRPAKKHKFRLQYTPMSYESTTTFQRNIVFNGILYPVALPVASEFDWNVLRFGYEYDFVYTPRGYVGVVIEGRYTRFNAALTSPIASEFATARAPLPALGFAARGYVMKNVALNLDWTFFNLDTFHLPESLIKDTTATYHDVDINGTINFNENIGAQVGWRQTTTLLGIDQDHGNLKFQGMWFGVAVRY
ncbi:MAG TPA: hypothetical protein VJN96_16005 [Vicinamibacterales bacterium]|nr:hypothetical protein [Vicinamibacterales bacterium]